MSIKPKSYVQVIVDGEEGSAEILSQLWELSTKLLIAMRDSDLPIEICPDVAFLTYARITAMVDAHDQKGVDLHWLNSVGAERQEMFRGFYLLQQQLGQVTRGEATNGFSWACPQCHAWIDEGVPSVQCPVCGAPNPVIKGARQC